MTSLAQDLVALGAQISLKAEESGDVVLSRLAARAMELSEAPAAAGRMLTARELGEHLKKPEKAIRELKSAGEIPFHQVGGSIRFDLCEVLEATRRRKN